MQKVLGLIKKEMEFSGVIKKISVESPGVLVIKSVSSTIPVWIFSGIARFHLFPPFYIKDVAFFYLDGVQLTTNKHLQYMN